MKKLAWFFAALILLTPLGLLASGGAWGEWGVEDIEKLKGFVPQGMSRFSSIVRAVLPDYSLPGLDGTFFQTALGYIISALVGVALIALIFWLLSRLFPKQATEMKTGEPGRDGSGPRISAVK